MDVRTRRDAPADPVDAPTFFEHLLPVALADSADRVEQWVLAHDLRPLTVVVDGSSATLAAEAGRIVVHHDGGPSGAAVLRLTAHDLDELVTDQVTPVGWFASGALRLEHGRLEDVLDWWLLLRAALDDATPHMPGDVELVDASGAPVDLHRAFGIDDDPSEMADFLRTAGFLHIAGVFTEAEMAAVSADMDAAAPRYAKGDGRSWWARLHDGTDALVRMQGFERESARAAALLADDRLTRLADLTGDGHRPPVGTEALFKPIGVTEGISDIPWHKDCSLGRHSYMCCGMTVGISVTGADDTSGRLRVVAGSHRALVWPAPQRQPGLDLPVVPLATGPGDLTVHLSCTLHMAQPPTERPRRVLYTGMGLPPLDESGAAAGAARLRAIREAAPVTVSQNASVARP